MASSVQTNEMLIGMMSRGDVLQTLLATSSEMTSHVTAALVAGKVIKESVVNHYDQRITQLMDRFSVLSKNQWSLDERLDLEQLQDYLKDKENPLLPRNAVKDMKTAILALQPSYTAAVSRLANDRVKPIKTQFLAPPARESWATSTPKGTPSSPESRGSSGSANSAGFLSPRA